MSDVTWGFNATRIRAPRHQGARAIDALVNAPAGARYAHFLVDGETRWVVDARALLAPWARRCAADAELDEAAESVVAGDTRTILLIVSLAISARVARGEPEWVGFDLYSTWLEAALEAAAVGISIAEHAALINQGGEQRTSP